MKLELRPITFKAACAYVERLHRHHQKPRGCKFALSAWLGFEMVGVAIAGRPVARRADDGFTVEVTRVCTDGTRNVSSFLYGAMAKAARALGYLRIITYSLPEEGGASLRGAGWAQTKTTRGGSWSRENRKRDDKHPTDPKWLWERDLS